MFRIPSLPLTKARPHAYEAALAAETAAAPRDKFCEMYYYLFIHDQMATDDNLRHVANIELSLKS